jgi:competence ComEA-like helix-hairpin-helix protein
MGKLRAERDQALQRLQAAERQLKQAKAAPAVARETAEEPTKRKPPAKPPAEGKRPKKAAKRKEPQPEKPSGPVDLNEATFEQLRGLGFTAAQANRVIAYRDRLGGYESLEDIATVPGIQRELVTRLKDALRV